MEVADDDEKRSDESEEPIVAFFRALSKASRAEYETLAERDRKFGEDIAGEVRS